MFALSISGWAVRLQGPGGSCSDDRYVIVTEPSEGVSGGQQCDRKRLAGASETLISSSSVL